MTQIRGLTWLKPQNSHVVLELREKTYILKRKVGMWRQKMIMDMCTTRRMSWGRIWVPSKGKLWKLNSSLFSSYLVANRSLFPHLGMENTSTVLIWECGKQQVLKCVFHRLLIRCTQCKTEANTKPKDVSGWVGSSATTGLHTLWEPMCLLWNSFHLSDWNYKLGGLLQHNWEKACWSILSGKTVSCAVEFLDQL